MTLGDADRPARNRRDPEERIRRRELRLAERERALNLKEANAHKRVEAVVSKVLDHHTHVLVWSGSQVAGAGKPAVKRAASQQQG